MKDFEERSTRVYRQKQMFSKQELEDRENVCIRDEPAFCAAACPLKLDARAFVKSMKEGDYTGARAQLERIAPFPFILSRGCEAPCEQACRLAEMGEGIGIGALERACMALGTAKSGRGMLKMKKRKTVAIFGADLFSLALAGELANKAYPVSFFCEEGEAAAIIDSCAPFLTEAEAAAEAERLDRFDIALKYNTELTAAFFEERREGFDILCASRAFAKMLDPKGEPDGVTLVLPAWGIIAPTAETSGVLRSLFDAKRAAISVDRLAQNMDPATARGVEGAVKSRLYTNMEGVEPSRRVPEGSGYSAEEAKQEASRCIECSCQECAKGCAYLRHYKKFPRQLTREIYNNVSIIMGDHMMNKPINSCALCGQCSVTCPFGYDMASVCHIARENMVSTGKMPLAPHEFALQDMLFSNGEAFLSKPQPGFETCRYVFFPGCQAGAIAPETVKRAYEDLCNRLDGGVALILGCCGAIADWAGRYELFGRTCDDLKGEIAQFGEPQIIAGCPTCQKTLEKILGKEALGIWDILNQIGLPDAKGAHQTVAMHDSCGARGNGKTQKAVRDLAKSLGLKLIETAYSGDKSPCCGYGGLVSYANREVAQEFAQSCVARSDAPFLTYCMACRDRFAREGHDSAHILELVYGPPAGAPPDISEKRRNRLSLKNRLLKELWGEDAMEKDWGFTLTITEEARLQMDDRMILDSDVYAVMQAYRETGDAILDSETDLLITRHRIGNVTFWVKFEEKDGGYVIRGAYSHRMIVK
ncbi:MAG: pyridine nucleotide-disulfide oxidoreductase/dicluster-binding protein [Christensenellales bacterium]|jgi:Fe-S oxidoreductase